MFDDWSDPYDIDHYYNDVNTIFSKVAEYVDPTKQPIAMPITVESASPTTQSSSATKDGFEVVPNSIFIDDHAVGSQPEYNILRSGPPRKKDTYEDRYYRPMPTMEYYPQLNIIHIIMWIVIGVLILHVIKLNAAMQSNQLLIYSLLQHIMHPKR